MRKVAIKIRVFASLVLAGSTLFCCDTDRNIENPDLHYFVKYYGGDGDQSGVDMEILNDGSMLLLGNSVKSLSKSDAYVVHVDSEGKVIAERTFGIGTPVEGIITAKDLEPAGDGNFIILADYRESLDIPSQITLLKISPDGVLLDSVGDIGTQANDISLGVTLLDDGGFMVTGTTEFTSNPPTGDNPDPDLGDIFNYRFDQNLGLDADWGPVFIGWGSHLDVAVKAFEVSPSLFYTFAYTNSAISGMNPNERLGLFYFERDNTGTQGQVLYPGNIVNVNDTEISFVERVSPALGGGYLIVGTSQNSIGVSDIFFARLRESLTFSVTNDATLYNTISLGRNIRGVSAASSVVGTAGFLILGNEIRSTKAYNIWLSKIDQSGSLLWSSTFGSETGIDTGAAVRELSDGKIVIVGTVKLTDNQSKMALFKVNATGQLLK
jgi:hypothetical protein